MPTTIAASKECIITAAGTSKISVELLVQDIDVQMLAMLSPKLIEIQLNIIINVKLAPSLLPSTDDKNLQFDNIYDTNLWREA